MGDTWQRFTCLTCCAKSGEQLRALLLEHGSFEEVEVAIQKWHEEVEQNRLEGGFFTKTDLEKEGWTETLGKTCGFFLF